MLVEGEALVRRVRGGAAASTPGRSRRALAPGAAGRTAYDGDTVAVLQPPAVLSARSVGPGREVVARTQVGVGGAGWLAGPGAEWVVPSFGGLDARSMPPAHLL
jgi:hypothetical protein